MSLRSSGDQVFSPLPVLGFPGPCLRLGDILPQVTRPWRSSNKGYVARPEVSRSLTAGFPVLGYVEGYPRPGIMQC